MRRPPSLALFITLPIMGWALAFPLIKVALEDLSFINLTLLRFTVACSALLVILGLQRRRFAPLHKRDVTPLFLLGFFGVMVYHLGLNYGEQYVSPGAASLIVATIPVLVVILAVMFLDERVTPRKVGGIGLSLTGLVILTVWGSEATIEVDYVVGALAVLLAAVMGAVYTVAGKKMLERYSALSLTLYAMLLGSIGLLPLVRWSFVTEVASMSWETGAAVVFLGLVSTIVSYALWYMALEVKGASELSVYLYAVPVISTLVSYLLFDDPITPLFVVGGGLVILGVAVVNRARRVVQPQ